MLVPEAFLRFDGEGRLVDEGVRAEIGELLDTLARVADDVTLAAA